jgi:hypothetical protein
MPALAQPRSRLLRWLTPLSIIVGVVSLISYASGAAFLLRMKDPALGAWWDDNQFYFMEGSATALGLLFALRLARRLINDRETRTKCTTWAGMLGAIALAPLTHVCATAASSAPDALEAAAADWLVGLKGYQSGEQLEKLLIVSVYFLKTICLSLIAGFALVAIVIAVLFVAGGPAGTEAAQSESQART